MKKVICASKGFTLIELMLVVAIIGILAAIAIPQYAQYRMRSYNASAQSDMRNGASAEAGLFTDVQSFGASGAEAAKDSSGGIAFAGGSGGSGDLCTGPAPAGTTHTLTITVQDGNSINSGIPIDVSNNVTFVAHTDAVDSANPRASSYVVGAKHQNGNTYFGLDGDNGAIYQDKADAKVNAKLTTSDIPASTVNVDDFGGNSGPSGEKWQVK